MIAYDLWHLCQISQLPPCISFSSGLRVMTQFPSTFLTSVVSAFPYFYPFKEKNTRFTYNASILLGLYNDLIQQLGNWGFFGYLYGMVLKSISTGLKSVTFFPFNSGIRGKWRRPNPRASFAKSRSMCNMN